MSRTIAFQQVKIISDDDAQTKVISQNSDNFFKMLDPDRLVKNEHAFAAIPKYFWTEV
jgi:hypothetical protein